MKHILTIVIFIFSFPNAVIAQSPADSLIQIQIDSISRLEEARQLKAMQDSSLKTRRELAIREDSVKRVHAELRSKVLYAGFQSALQAHPLFHFDGPPLQLTIETKKPSHSDGIFYFILSLIIYFGLIRLFFYKYLSALFTLFFRATFRQQQLREQLHQAPLPALLLNIFFAVNAGAYFTFLSHHLDVKHSGTFWMMLGYSIIVVAVIYIVKYIVLKIAGWIFGISTATDTYIFVIFLINKMIGILLLPILVLLAFPNPALVPAALAISYLLIGCLFLYRYIISYRPIRNEIKLNKFHFILYLCAFELAPLFLIYKVLLSFLSSSY